MLMHDRVVAVLGGLLALLAFAAAQAAHVRESVIALASLVVGKSIEKDYWNAFLTRNSFLLLAIGAALLAYCCLQKRTLDRAMTYVMFLNGAGEAAAAARRRVILASGFALGVSLVAAAGLTRLSMYAPDSWSFFELARTVFSGEFFKFTTYRSYFSEPYSSSFPLGYPVLVSAAHLVFGAHPLAAVWMNVLIAAATWPLILRLATRLGLSPLVGFAMASSLALWTFYLVEVLGGLSQPAALLLFLTGASLYLSGQLFLSGLFLGLAALVRFDYLAFALVFLLGALLLGRRSLARKLPLSAAGFAAGISPWVVYSLTHFGRLWVSDNSWVAFSALPAFVLDFPAAAAVTAFDNPGMWLARVAGNLGPLAKMIAAAALRFPLVIALGLLFVYCYRSLDRAVRLRAIACLALLCASLGPYLLTGYTDKRYFGLPFLVACVVFAHSVESWTRTRGRRVAYHVLILLSLACSLLLGGRYLAWRSWSGIEQLNEPDTIQSLIETLAQCHAGTPEATYIFMDRADVTPAARYGATTGRRAAFIPSNFDRMTREEKDRYLERMKPYVPIETFNEPEPCRPQN